MSRRRETREAAVTGLAGLMWAPLAAAVALLLNIPIRGFVERPRPSVEHRGLEVLGTGDGGYSFVSGHATLVMALAVGIFMVHRRYGLVGIGLAVVAGISRLYMGVHYPTDVVGGLALGTAVALLLAPARDVAADLARTGRRKLTAHGPLVWAGRDNAAANHAPKSPLTAPRIPVCTRSHTSSCETNGTWRRSAARPGVRGPYSPGASPSPTASSAPCAAASAREVSLARRAGPTQPHEQRA